MFDRTIGLDPRPAAPQSRTHYRMRDGHRREYDASRDRGSTSFRDRSEPALADVGIYRCVSFRDLAETHFGGHPYTTRRAVNAWIREGLAKESTAKGPKGGCGPSAGGRHAPPRGAEVLAAGARGGGYAAGPGGRARGLPEQPLRERSAGGCVQPAPFDARPKSGWRHSPLVRSDTLGSAVASAPVPVPPRWTPLPASMRCTAL